ncbi:hypothetical protein BDF19DRAFT_456318 [Syncephalis fuscata]|nr:hypothetical protein BDF19DRAFT_456318 [Syncephalis fuscata]
MRTFTTACLAFTAALAIAGNNGADSAVISSKESSVGTLPHLYRRNTGGQCVATLTKKHPKGLTLNDSWKTTVLDNWAIAGDGCVNVGTMNGKKVGYRCIADMKAATDFYHKIYTEKTHVISFTEAPFQCYAFWM